MTSFARFAVVASLWLVACNTSDGSAPAADTTPGADVSGEDTQTWPDEPEAGPGPGDPVEPPPPAPRPGPAVPEPCVTFTPDAFAEASARLKGSLTFSIDIDYVPGGGVDYSSSNSYSATVMVESEDLADVV